MDYCFFLSFFLLSFFLFLWKLRVVALESMLCLLERGGRLTHRNLEFSFGFLFLFSFFSFRRLVLNITVNDCN